MSTVRFPTRLALLTAAACLLLAACGDDQMDGPKTLAHVDGAEGDLMPRYAPGGDGFFRMPWPSDSRVSAQGSVDISDIPSSNNAFVKKYVNMLSEIHGFSTMPVGYFTLEGDAVPDPDTLPTPTETLDSDASVQLIDMSEDGCGERIPLEVVFDEEGDEFIDPHTVKAAPIPGWPLQPARPYAFVVTTSFGGPGLTTGRPQAFADYLNGDGEDAALNESFAPLRKCLPQAGVSAVDVAVATVFTTQDPVAETRKLREAVWNEDTPLKNITDWSKLEDRSTSTYTVYTGTAQFPIFQVGEPPYSRAEEGGLEFDAQGRPVIQRWESVPIAVSVPTTSSDSLKLLVWEDGTGATLQSHIGDRHIAGALAEGFAVATFVPQFHHNRGETDFDPELDTFNYTNPRSGRTVFRQQVAETSYFIRLLEGKLATLSGLPDIDTSRVFYGGHSQGALVGAMVGGVEPRIDTYVLSGVGSYLSETIVFRKEPFDIAALVKSILNVSRPIDRFHPIVQMAQLGADAVDPHNYAIYWKGWPAHEGGSNFFLIDGKNDTTTSTLSMNMLMTVGDVPPVGTAGWDVDPYGLRNVQSYDPPVEANREATNGDSLTYGAYLSPNNGHFTLYDQRTAATAAVNFWSSSADGSAVIDY